MLVVAQPQRAGERVEHIRRRTQPARLLQPDHVVDAHPGQLRDLFPAQARRTACPPSPRQVDVFGGEALTPRPQEHRQLVRHVDIAARARTSTGAATSSTAPTSTPTALDTDYIDLLYLHAWDFTTPVEEVLRAMDDLVRAGKVLYVGISDTPAWQVAHMQTIADLRGWSPLVALQIEYSLIERTVERDLIPMAGEMGLGVVPWSPLGSGVLTGKYTRDDLDHGGASAEAEGTRKNVAAANGALTERGLAIAEVVKKVATDLGATPSQVALAWTMRDTRVASPIIGARSLAQLEDNLGALDLTLTDAALADLETASAVELGFPHEFLTRPMTQNVMFGDLRIERNRHMSQERPIRADRS